MQVLLNQVKSYLFSFDDKPEQVQTLFQVLDEILQNQDNYTEQQIFTLKGALAIAMEDLSLYSTAMLAIVYVLFPELYSQKDQKIHQLVQAYQQINRLDQEVQDRKSNSYFSYVLLVSKDLRALLMGIAIELQKLRRASAEKPPTQSELERIHDFYIPLCHRLGFYRIKSEMEDRLLFFQKPQVYTAISRKIQASSLEREGFIREFLKPIEREMENHKLDYKIKWRMKSLASIHAKMQKQGIPFEKVYDLFAIRIILNSPLQKEKADCWHVYSVITNIYRPQINRLRDWISVPRPNGYESLHITVDSKARKAVEVQIRTKRMDDEAENGLAAHWRYKGGKSDEHVNTFLLKIRKAIEQGDRNEEVFKSAVDSKDLFVFTPSGELRKLRAGATVLDFAFSIHTEVGVRCSGARVNGKIKPIKHTLSNGDRVEIMTTKNQKPTLDWLNFVISSRAKSRIRKAVDARKQFEVEEGKEILMRKLKHWKIDFKQSLLDKLSNQFNRKNIGDLYRDIYLERIDTQKIKSVLMPSPVSISDAKAKEIPDKEHAPRKMEDKLIVDETDQLGYKLAGCCHPVPGDSIFGFVTISRGISIHRDTCPNAKSMKERYPYRILPAKWKSKEEVEDFRTVLFLKGINKDGVLGDISQIVGVFAVLLQVNIHSHGHYFQGKISVGIKEKKQLNELVKKLLSHEDILECYRIKS